MLVVTTEEMRRLEQAAVDAGDTWDGLMEHAGWGVAQEALRYLGVVQARHVVVLVGSGNNGGDGLVVARHLHDAGASVHIYLWRRTDVPGDMNWQRCRQRGIAETLASDDIDQSMLRQLLTRADMVIDALLGMGVSREVSGDLACIVDVTNSIRAQKNDLLVLSIDLPTGTHSDHGTILGISIHADATVATGLCKRGLLFYPGKGCAGTLSVADIGIPSEHLEGIMSKTITVEQARALLPHRSEDAHKGTFGKALVVAGSLLYPGAAALASAGAGRAGAGLVTLATARSITALSGRGPEVTLLPLPEADLGTLGPAAAVELLKNIDGYTSLLIGPGLGREESTSLFLQRLFGLEQPQKRQRVGFRIQAATQEAGDASAETHELPPTVIDADGLNLLAQIDEWYVHVPAGQCILTPHPGEMKRLLHVEELDADQVKVATQAAAQWQQVVVLKGATTVIAAPDGRSAIYADGNPALATAGTGDVLSGVITGLLAQKMDLFDAAVLGVYLHAAAGALLREELGDMGTLASDLLPRLPLVIKALCK